MKRRWAEKYQNKKPKPRDRPFYVPVSKDDLDRVREPKREPVK